MLSKTLGGSSFMLDVVPGGTAAGTDKETT